MIRTEHLTKRFNKFTAVDDLSLHVRDGEVYGFLGPNGAGKTTTINMLLGILKPSAGAIYFDNTEMRRGDISIKRDFGVVPENHPRGMWKWMTAAEYLRFFADFFRVQNAGVRINELLESVNLAEVAHKHINAFSRGMLQKLSIARALLHNPRVLILDEPISGLDPLGVRQIRDLLEAENKRGKTILISSHLLSEVEKICHRVAIISEGMLLSEDSKEDLMNTLHADREIQIDIERPTEELTAKMRKLDFVLGAEVSESGLTVKISREGDYRKAISEFLFQQGQVPLALHEKDKSLEDLFITITKENLRSITSIEDQG